MNEEKQRRPTDNKHEHCAASEQQVSEIETTSFLSSRVTSVVSLTTGENRGRDCRMRDYVIARCGMLVFDRRVFICHSVADFTLHV